MTSGIAATTSSTVRSRFRAARMEAALTGMGTAIIGSGVGIAALLVWLAEGRGMIEPGSWLLVLGGGMGVLVAKIALDLIDRDDDAGLWRRVLTEAFGDEMRSDSEVARQARLAIEFRTRLAASEAKANRSVRRSIGPLLHRMDHLLDAIVVLAKQTAAERNEARFQTGLSSRSGRRLNEIASQVRTVQDPSHARALIDAADGLASHVKAADGLSRRVDDAFLRLERAVATLGAVTSESVLMLSRGASAGKTGELDEVLRAEILRLGSEMVEPPI